MAGQQALAQQAEKIVSCLVSEGFENVRLVKTDDMITVTMENQVYRWDVQAIRTAMGIVTGQLKEPAGIQLLLLERDVPRLLVRFRSDDWKKFISGEIPVDSMVNYLVVSEETRSTWQTIRSEKPENRNYGRTDVVLYPQFSFENTLKARLYTGQLNIAPAIQLLLFRGVYFTGQVIFPLYNELGYEGDFIRPGQILLSKDIKFNRLSGRISAGKFGNDRYGGDLFMACLLPDQNWSLKFNTGLTGTSHFLDHQLKLSPLKTLTWSLSATWFIPRFNTGLEGGIRQYLYGDYGIFGSCTRWFGETAVGFYALVTNEHVNGGFQFSIPYPFKKRSRKHFLRLTIPDHQDMVYNAGTEFRYGQTYRAGPEINMIKGWYNFDYMKNNLLTNVKK
jgi:hypothetical protein